MNIKTVLINWIKENHENIPEPIIYVIGKIGNQFSYYVRYGKEFKDTYDELERTEFLDKEELNQIVTKKLLDQVNYALQNVPYYRKHGYGANSTINSIADFERLPIIDKEIVKSNVDLFISDLYDIRDLILKKTSGSTGTPLGIYMTKDTTLKEWAFVVHIWKRVGYNAKSSRIIMREIEQKEKGICYFDALKNELRVDISAMTEQNLKVYCDAIEKYKPDYIHGYPSATLQLCKYIENHSIKHHFKGVLPSSEGLSIEEQAYIEKVLSCPVLSFYGHTERLVMAGQCEQSTMYHVEPLYGYCELVDSEGNIIRESNKTGEIVATGFCNRAMPLIRYRTGDLAQWSDEICGCGRNVRLLKSIEGRKTEYLVDKENNKISLTSFRYSFCDRHVKAFQFYQEKAGEVIFRVVPEIGYCNEDSRYIIQTLREDANDRINFMIEQCASISRKSSGKREVIIQKVGR